MPQEDRTKLTLESEVEGADRTVRSLDELDDKIGEVESTTQGATKATDATAEATDKARASAGDYAGVIDKIVPGLGSFISAGENLSRVIGDLGSSSVNLTGVFGKLKTAVLANRKALLTIGASGAVVAGIMLIVRAVRLMREETDKATAAEKAHQEALDEGKAKRRDLQTELEKASAGLRGGPFDQPETDTAQAQVERLGRKTPFVDEGARARAAVIASRTGLTDDQIERLAIAIGELGENLDGFEKRSAGAREAGVEALLRRRGGAIDTVIGREGAQTGQDRQAAAQEREAGGGSVSDIVRALEALPGAALQGQDVEQIARLVQAQSDLNTEDFQDVFTALGGVFKHGLGQTRDEVIALKAEDLGFSGTTSEQIVLARAMARTLEQIDRRDAARDANPANVTTNIFDNSRTNTAAATTSNGQHRKTDQGD